MPMPESPTYTVEPVVDDVLAAERGRHRHVVRLGEGAEVGRRLRCPRTAADERERSSGVGEQCAQLRELLGSGMALRRPRGRRVVDRHDVREHVLGKRERNRTRPPGARGPERLLQQLGQALGPVDLRDPLAELRQEATVVDLLERLAIQHPAADLADQHHERGRVLEGDVQPRRAVGRAGPARHEAHAGSPGELAVGLGHHRRGALLACRHEPDRVPCVVQGVEHGQVALAGHAEDELDALRAQAVDQHVATPPRTAHGQMPPMQRYLTSSHSSSPYFEPSRPMPDSLTPPNGDTSFEMKPVLMPTIPVSSPSETRQMRPMSRE